MAMKRFQLLRTTDVSGVSGVGTVAEGVLFEHTGQAVMCWLTERSSLVTFSSVDDLEWIHGHQGASRIVWLDA